MSRQLGLLICCALLAYAHTAHAQQRCEELTNPLYLQVGDTQEPLMKTLGRALRDSAAKPITLVYVTSGSCTNIEAIYTDVPITMNAKFVPSTEEDAGWKTSDPPLTCTIAEAGHPVDVANSALFVSACNPDDPPDGVKLFQGPNQAYAFIVPESSSERAITAEEAYFVFGFGAAGKVSPWDDESFFAIRTVTKSTLLSLAAAIRVPGPRWKGMPFDKSSEVLSAVTSASEPGKAIGILGTELYDRNRDQVNVLAFRAFGQKLAYYPDSTASAFDKRNVRDGHYFPCAPTVWLTHVEDDKPTNPLAEYVIGLILGNTVEPKPDFEPLESVIDVGLVPACAMKVTRSKEGGDLSLYAPEEPCGCYYESKVAEPSSGCSACEEDDDCDAGACRHGFCEVR
jgi:hypothetical protein